MFKAIRTRYVPCTNTKPSRIVAQDGDGHRVSVSYDDALTSDDAHRLAAQKLMDKMQWNHHDLHAGGYGHDNYWVMVPRAATETTAAPATATATFPTAVAYAESHRPDTSAEWVNNDRANRAFATLDYYRDTHGDTDTPTETDLADLLADLRHWCDVNGIDFAAEDNRAYRNYTEELEVTR
jgi:hypothetical protein